MKMLGNGDSKTPRVSDPTEDNQGEMERFQAVLHACRCMYVMYILPGHGSPCRSENRQPKAGKTTWVEVCSSMSTLILTQWRFHGWRQYLKNPIFNTVNLSGYSPTLKRQFNSLLKGILWLSCSFHSRLVLIIFSSFVDGLFKTLTLTLGLVARLAPVKQTLFM